VSGGFGLGTVPSTLPNYGTDLSGITDLDATLAETSGLTMLGQALARRLITPRGTLCDDPNYGFDVRGYLNDDLAPADVARIAAGIDAELVKDERVFASSTTATLTAAGVLTTVTSVTPGAGPAFRLVLGITSVTVQVLSVGS
jgi:hypothetical protein